MQVSRHWREFSSHYKLEGKKCEECGEIHFPPRDVCSECKSTELSNYELKGKGEVVSYTMVRSAPPDHEYDKPYPLALIELKDGPVITAQLTDVAEEDINVGMDVEMVIRKVVEQGEDGLILYAYKFRPTIE